MSAASIRFFLFSLCFHLVLLWAFLQRGGAEYGLMPAKPGSHPAPVVWAVHAVPDDRPSIPKTPRQSPAVTAPPAKQEWPTRANAAPEHDEPEPAKDGNSTAVDQEYAIAGNLTRLPVPITDIDLNVPGINDSDVISKVELTILIDRNGNVSDVIPAFEMESARVFAERVAQRFRMARFKPGEINGKAVNAQLRITVMSESLTGTGKEGQENFSK